MTTCLFNSSNEWLPNSLVGLPVNCSTWNIYRALALTWNDSSLLPLLRTTYTPPYTSRKAASSSYYDYFEFRLVSDGINFWLGFIQCSTWNIWAQFLEHNARLLSHSRKKRSDISTKYFDVVTGFTLYASPWILIPLLWSRIKSK